MLTGNNLLRSTASLVPRSRMFLEPFAARMVFYRKLQHRFRRIYWTKGTRYPPALVRRLLRPL
jgi:hypothetical protein